MDDKSVQSQTVKSVSQHVKESESKRMAEGDCLDVNSLKTLKQVEHITILTSDIPKLKDCWNKLSPVEQFLFRQLYGSIIVLLDIKVPKMAIKALIRFWDPSYRCFTFGSNDLMPTIEEYHHLLWLGNNMYHVYDRGNRASTVDSVEKYIDQVGMIKARKDVAGKNGWAWPEMQKLFDYWGTQDDLLCVRVKILAFGIFGLVLFPTVAGTISVDAADVFLETATNKANPISAILADTLLSMDYCRTNGSGGLRCCVQLLFVWIISHMPKYQDLLYATWFRDRHYLEGFTRVEWAKRGEQQWVNEFLTLGNGSVHWWACYMTKKPHIVSCGSRSWLPLMGSYGYVACAPSLVARQFGCRQGIPRTKGLAECCGKYTDQKTPDELSQIAIDWTSLTEVEARSEEEEELGITDGYVLWQASRVKNCEFPLSMPVEVNNVPVTEGQFSSETGPSTSKKRKNGMSPETQVSYEDLLLELQKTRMEKLSMYDNFEVERKSHAKELENVTRDLQEVRAELREARIAAESSRVQATKLLLENKDLKHENERLRWGVCHFDNSQAREARD